MLILLVFAVWFTPGDPDVVRAFPQNSLAGCEVARAAIIAYAAAHAHEVDARCIVLKPATPT